MAKKVLTAVELENARLNKNRILREWRAAHKERVAAYMQQWHAEKKQRLANEAAATAVTTTPVSA